jgi:hypothetical protein
MPAPSRNAKKKGMSRRDLEWHARDLVRGLPSDHQALAKAVAEMIVAMIHKNNEELSKSDSSDERRHDEEGF